MNEKPINAEKPTEAEPLAIWFFVGMILLVYGLIVVGAGLFSAPRATVLAQLRPGLWWGGITAVAGVVFLLIGLRGRRSS